jgi:polysaccharide biosynthesis/export protein
VKSRALRKTAMLCLCLLSVGPFSIAMSSDQPTFAVRSPRYTLRPGDVLDVSFRYSPTLDQSVSVQPDGFINLREIGEINVQGKTVPELVALLTQKYSDVLNKPEIFVSLKQSDPPHIIVTGEVARPGRYDLHGDTTVSAAVGIAGGLTKSSKHSDVLVVRFKPDSTYTVERINLKQIYAGNFAEDVHLRPDDMVIVPKSKTATIREYMPPIGVGLTPSNF